MQHFAVNETGSIKRLYRHEGTRTVAVRTISLRNYYMIEDEQAARLIMVTDPALEWVRELPVAYYPVSNKALKALDSVDAMFQYHGGAGNVIPARLRQALTFSQLLMLVQVVPGQYLNALAAVLKQQAKFVGAPVKVDRLILAYYRSVVKDADSQIYHVVYSYISACRYTETKLNMRVRSVKRLAEERAVVARKRELRRIPEFKTHREFVLPQRNYGDVRLELIDTKKRLAREAKAMKSCVDTYARSIADGRCAIYHVRYRGRHYTLELRLDERGRLFAAELLGVRNSPATEALANRIASILHER